MARRACAAIASTALLVFALLATSASASEGPLYKATSERGTVYLFGSIHFGAADFYPLSDAVYAALDGSSTLLVELDINNIPPEQAVQAMAMMVLPRGESLQTRLGEALWARVESTAIAQGVPPASLQELLPWTAAIILGAAPFTQAGLDPLNGVDQHMLAQARERSMPVVELETMASQLGIFQSLSDSEQARMLAVTLDQLESAATQGMAAQIVGAWRTGDEAVIESVLNTTLRKDAPELARQLLDVRNLAMATNSLAALDSSANRSIMVVVGAAHLTGATGLVELLRREGFELTKL